MRTDHRRHDATHARHHCNAALWGRRRRRRTPLVAEELRVHASAGLVLLTQGALDTVLVRLVALVVRGVVLRLGHFL